MTGFGEEGRAESALRAWAAPIVGRGAVSFARPDQPSVAASGVNFHLEAIEAGRPPAAHYTVTTWAQAPSEASAMLARVVMAAIDHPELDVDLGLPPRATWPALGPEPRPRCQLRVTVPPVRSVGRRWR
jgi:hypothetical protein